MVFYSLDVLIFLKSDLSWMDKGKMLQFYQCDQVSHIATKVKII